MSRRQPSDSELRLDRHALVRRVNERAVLDAVFRDGPITRVALARATGLSKPTISALIATLEDLGLVHQVGRTNGQVGRAAALYAINARFGHVVGIDVGATKLRVAVSDLFGELLVTTVEPTPSGGSALLQQIVRAARAACAHADAPWETVRSVVVGTPGVLDPDSDHVSLAPNIHGLRDLSILTALKRRLRTDVVVENDVNLSAVGERWRGCAADQDDFIFLGVGTGFGMGIVVNGELFRGSRGAAGEIAFLPLGADAFSPAARREGALETAAAGSGIRRRAQELRSGVRTSLGPRASPEHIFAAAAQGDELGLRVVEEEARLIALAALSACAVLDPQLIVLGGGVGANPALLEPVREALGNCMPFPVRVETTHLGELAALNGALAVGLSAARTGLLR